MLTRHPRALVAAAVALLLVVAGLVGVTWWRHSRRDGLEAALRLVPDDAQRYSWTDWAGVRQALKMDDDDPTEAQVDRFLQQGFSADLTSASAMVTSAGALQSTFGFSPATAEWELFAQSDDGAVVVVEPASTDGIEHRLSRAGYTRGKGGVWDGSEAATDLGITPEFGHVAVHDGRVYASDSADYLEEVVGGGFSPSDPVADVVGAVRGVIEPISAVVYSGDYACGHLAMSQADDVDQAQGVELIRQAGGVDPLTAFAMAAGPDRDVTVGLGFESHDKAVRNADARAILASGAAPGQGGSFSERFRLGRVEAKDDTVTMRLHPVAGAYVLSDLSTGPVLFASC
ncbi:hypothetical protein SAMN04487968_102152 [Nocardioides terrae]|uniref:Uncharacterized protein n=1 Tax=Nocardioides terrae TaxID=574651 RepID=A0A1I1EMV9_9ACTN|nr:hypothetical protein [Nocardioides terrae]SFB88441.1 hypothetical protein SAMN04487968_102152 [Nocardioides terrae]